MKRFFLPPFFFLLLLLLALVQPSIVASPASQASPTGATRSDQYRALLKLLARKEYAQAQTACRVLIERYPDFSPSFGKLVVIARATAQIPQTEEYLRTLAPGNPLAWHALGLLAQARGNHEEAFALQQQCLAARPNYPPAAAAVALAADALNAPARAEAFFQTRPQEAAFVYGRGFLAVEQRQNQRALEFFEQALQLQPGLTDALREKILLLNVPGRLPEVLALCEQMLRLIDEREDPEQRRFWVDFKGRRLYQLAQYQQAIQVLNDAVRLAREYEWREYEERSLSFLATSKLYLNYFSEALEDYQRGLELTRQGKLPYLSRNLGNIGLTYRNLGDRAKSAEYYQQAIEAGRGGSDAEGLRAFLLNLSELHLELGAPQKAQPLLAEAEQIVNRTNDNYVQYQIRAGWARYHYFTRNYASALKSLQAALQIVEQRGNRLQQGTSLNLMGDCQFELQDRTAAAAAYQQALAIGQQIQVLAVIWRAEAGLARLAQDTQPQEALTHYRRAIDAIEKIRTRQTGSEEKTGYFQETTDVYQQAVALLVTLHRRTPTAGHGAEAFHLAERIRARTLLDSLTETTAHLEQRLEPDLIARQQEIQRRLSAAEKQLQDFGSALKPTPETIRKLEADLLRAAQDYSDWRKQVRQRNPYLAELTLPEPLTLEQTQRALK